MNTEALARELAAALAERGAAEAIDALTRADQLTAMLETWVPDTLEHTVDEAVGLGVLETFSEIRRSMGAAAKALQVPPRRAPAGEAATGDDAVN